MQQKRTDHHYETSALHAIYDYFRGVLYNVDNTTGEFDAKSRETQRKKERKDETGGGKKERQACASLHK